MDYLGLNLYQSCDGIRLLMSKYIDSIIDIKICSTRRSNKEAKLLAAEFNMFHRAVGQLS